MSRNMITSKEMLVKRSLFNDLKASVGIAVLIFISAVVGLGWSSVVYPTDELYNAFIPNDVINLAVGLPVLLVALWLTRRGKLLGLLFWPGALLYMVYNYMIYLIAMPVNLYSLFFLVLSVGSLAIVVRLLANFDGDEIQEKLIGKVPEKFSAGVMLVFGIFFIGRVVALVFEAVSVGVSIPVTELGLHIADTCLSMLLIVGAVQLWRRRTFGYVIGLGLLFQTSMLFIGLIAVLLLQPVFIGGQIPWLDIAVVFLMGFVTFIPFVMFARGVDRA